MFEKILASLVVDIKQDRSQLFEARLLNDEVRCLILEDTMDVLHVEIGVVVVLVDSIQFKTHLLVRLF